MRRVSLYTFVSAYLFWYGLSYINPAARVLHDYGVTISYILIFFIITVSSYSLVYKKQVAIVRKDPVRPGSRSLFYFISVIILLHLVYYLIPRSGMSWYHFSRVFSAFGCISVVFAFFFTGKIRALLLCIALAMAFQLLGLYSRRLALVIFAALLIVPVIKERYSLSKRIRRMLILGVSSFLLILISTGRRIASQSGSDFWSIYSSGYNAFVAGSGFDTVHLLDFTISRYGFDNFLLGQSFIAGFLNWVPRSVWPDKPIAFGVTLSSEYWNVDVDNLFTNFGPGIVSEAYANGGFIGVVATSILMGIALGYSDRAIEKYRFHFLGLLFGAIFLPALFFVVRGDFVNSWYEFYFKFFWAAVIYYSPIVRVHYLRTRPGVSFNDLN